ncbi:MAG: hypothetical protein E7391_05135 [Ruminococcaceae bacterium]|nr:hypothetical protein [Oscillospiraceae bacterium]
MKKITSVLLVFVMMLSMATFSVSALTEGDWEYKILDNEIHITRYLGKDTNVVVPDTIRGCPVVSIAVNKADYTRHIKTLILPDTLKELGVGAFYGSSSLETVRIPNDVKIGREAFANCKSLKSIDLSNVLILETGAFSDCENLENVILSENLQEIPMNAFRNTKLSHIDIPRSVKKIGQGAFHNTALESVIIPGTVEIIGQGAFSTCQKLKSVVISYGTKVLDYDRYSDLNGAFGTFSYCPLLEEIYIPDTVTKLIDTFVIPKYSPNAIVFCGENSHAAEICKKKEISYITDNSVNTKINVMYNGKRVSFHKYGQNPEIIDGRTLVPLRAIFEALGASVEWDENTQTVTANRDDTEISLQIGSNKMYVNGQEKLLDVPARIINSRTLVPVRAISEAFGCNVGWNENTQTVTITQ